MTDSRPKPNVVAIRALGYSLFKGVYRVKRSNFTLMQPEKKEKGCGAWGEFCLRTVNVTWQSLHTLNSIPKSAALRVYISLREFLRRISMSVVYPFSKQWKTTQRKNSQNKSHTCNTCWGWLQHLGRIYKFFMQIRRRLWLRVRARSFTIP